MTPDYLQYIKGTGLLKHMQSYRDQFREIQLSGYTVDGLDENGNLRLVTPDKITLRNPKRHLSALYILEKPVRFNPNLKNNLIVTFGSYDQASNEWAAARYFGSPFKSLNASVPYNTYVLRIGDSTGLTGSYYLNTELNPNLESDIRDLILMTANNLNVNIDDTIAYGNSRGGFPSIYYGATLGMKVVSVEPILNRTLAEQANSGIARYQHGIFDIIPFDFVPILNKFSGENIKILIAINSEVVVNDAKKLETFNVDFLDMQITASTPGEIHAKFIGATVPLQISYINQWIYQNYVSK